VINEQMQVFNGTLYRFRQRRPSWTLVPFVVGDFKFINHEGH
jgi:hypothetical protein